MHCHHEKAIVIDGRIAFVGGIDLTLDGGDPYDTPTHIARGGIGWHDAAVRIEGPAVVDVEEHFRLRWHGATRETLPRAKVPEPVGDVELQITRTLPAGTYRAVRRGDYSILESYSAALRSAKQFIYLENQFLWSPEIVAIWRDFIAAIAKSLSERERAALRAKVIGRAWSVASAAGGFLDATPNVSPEEHAALDSLDAAFETA